MSEAPPATSPMAHSERELAREVLIHGPISRSELGQRLGLSPASLTRLSKSLLDREIIVEGPELLEGAVGRPTKPLDVRVDSRRFIGIKVTGDDALGISTNLRAAKLATAQATFVSSSLEDVASAIVAIVAQLGGPDGISGIGISIGGNVTDLGVVQRAPFLEWRDVDLRTAIQERLGIPVTVDNDVLALTAGEHWFGLGRGLTDFAVLTIGAGVGYGLVINDHVIRVRDSGLGLLGHFPLDPTGPLCIDGHRGCSTAVLTMGSMCAQAAAVLGHPVDYDELLALASNGNPVAHEVVESAGRSLGRLIAAIANIAMVPAVILSGEGIALFDVIGDTTRAAIAADRDPEIAPIELLVDESGFTPWAQGAAAVAIQNNILDL